MNTKKIILASKSPRRQQLIKGLELDYEVATYDADESFDPKLIQHDIPMFLAQKKAAAYPKTIAGHEILLTADTIVWINDTVLNKPADNKEAFSMLKALCGNTHTVYTGVCLTAPHKQHIFFEATQVTCIALSDEEINHYISHYKPFDKAGSYGIQDWFGYAAVSKIEGCFYNVMGLPVSRLYRELQSFCQIQ